MPEIFEDICNMFISPHKLNCTTCKHTDTDQIGDRYCINDKSKHCSELVNKNMVCELWENNNV